MDSSGIAIGSQVSIGSDGTATFTGDIAGASGTFTGGVSGTGYSLNNSGLSLTNESSDIQIGNNVRLSSAGLSGNNFSLTSAGLNASDATISGTITATLGAIGGWTISETALSTGDEFTGMEADKDKGIKGRKATTSNQLHEQSSYQGEFSFGSVVHSIGPGGGGQTYNPDGTLNSYGSDMPTQDAE